MTCAFLLSFQILEKQDSTLDEKDKRKISGKAQKYCG